MHQVIKIESIYKSDIYKSDIYISKQMFCTTLYLTVVIAPDTFWYPEENGRNKCVSSQYTFASLFFADTTEVHTLFELRKLNG